MWMVLVVKSIEKRGERRNSIVQRDGFAIKLKAEQALRLAAAETCAFPSTVLKYTY